MQARNKKNAAPLLFFPTSSTFSLSKLQLSLSKPLQPFSPPSPTEREKPGTGEAGATSYIEREDSLWRWVLGVCAAAGARIERKRGFTFFFSSAGARAGQLTRGRSRKREEGQISLSPLPFSPGHLERGRESPESEEAPLRSEERGSSRFFSPPLGFFRSERK